MAKILIVEDNEMNMRLFSDLLKLNTILLVKLSIALLKGTFLVELTLNLKLALKHLKINILFMKTSSTH